MIEDAAPDRANELRELTLSAREGDLEAAYAILAEQVPVDTWVAVLRALKAKADEVDLELVAHRTLRRKPVAVPAAVLELTEAIGTTQAAFVATAIAHLRTETKIVERATALAQTIGKANPALGLLIDSRTTDALYATLSLSLAEQADVLSEIGIDDPARGALVDALRSEYERLQDLSKDKRWRSASYRHFLRHSLADLVLLAQPGGKLEDQAFRLLQQRTEEPNANRTLLALLPESTRRAYLSWVVDRPAGKEETARALFVLDEIENRYPNEVDRSSIERLVFSKDAAIAVAAASFVLRSAPETRSNDVPIAELLTRLPSDSRAKLVTRIAEEAPSRVRIDLWPRDADAILAPIPGIGVTEALLGTFEITTDPDAQRRQLQLLAARLPSQDVLTRISQIALGRARGSGAEEIQVILNEPVLRAGLWSALASADRDMFNGITPDLIRAEGAGAAVHLGQFVAAQEEVSPELTSFVFEACMRGEIDAATLASNVPKRFLDELDEIAARVEPDALGRREALEKELASGQSAAEAWIAREVQGVAELAEQRLEGNDRLRESVRSLANATRPDQEDDRPNEAQQVELPASFVGELEAAGVEVLDRSDPYGFAIPSSADVAGVLRLLALFDRRASRVDLDDDTRAASRCALVGILGAARESGLAAEATVELFEGGRLQRAMLALPAPVRARLVEEALSAGLQPPPAWSDHPALGAWLRPLIGETAASPETDSASPFVRTVEASVEAARLQSLISVQRYEAARAFAGEARPSLLAIESAMDAFVQLWQGLRGVGIEQVAPTGALLQADEIDANLHTITGEPSSTYLVRAGGLRVAGDILVRATVTGVHG